MGHQQAFFSSWEIPQEFPHLHAKNTVISPSPNEMGNSSSSSSAGPSGQESQPSTPHSSPSSHSSSQVPSDDDGGNGSQPQKRVHKKKKRPRDPARNIPRSGNEQTHATGAAVIPASTTISSEASPRKRRKRDPENNFYVSKKTGQQFRRMPKSCLCGNSKGCVELWKRFVDAGDSRTVDSNNFLLN